MRRFLRKPSPAMVVAFIALMAALAPTAAALRGVNLVSSNDIIRGAVKKSEVARDSVGPNEALEEGDRGGGFTGAQIEEDRLETVPSADALARVALISATGTSVRANGLRGVAKTGPGQYQLTWDRDVRSCHYLATLSGGEPGEITVLEPVAATPNAITVETSQGGAPADRAFHVAVSC